MLAYMAKPKQENEFVEYGQEFAGRLRDALGAMKKSELSKLLTEYGVELDAGRLSHYFTGRNYPDPPILAALCRALGISADWALGLTETELPVADLEERLAAATGEGKINKVMSGLSKDRQQQVIDFAEFLLSQEKKIPSSVELSQWIAATEVLMRRHGTEGEESFVAFLAAERPDLAAALGMSPKKKSIQDR